MSDDLLAKEKEFHKLNQELQLKNYDVMKKINFITHANVNDKLFNNTKQLYTSLAMKNIKTTYPENETLSTDKQLGKSSLEVSEVLSIENMADTEILLKKYNNLENEAIIKLFKGKIDMLHKKLKTIQFEYNNKCEYSKELEVKSKKFNETQVKLHNQIASLSDTVTKLQDTNYDILSKYQGLSNENIVLKKDLHSLNKKIKISYKQSSNCDIRLNRSLENNEKLRSMLKSSQIEEKELRNQIKKLQEDKSSTIKNFEKQQLELTQAFKKQIMLIDNLKLQNMYLMTSGQIHLTEEDFTKLLEWKPQRL